MSQPRKKVLIITYYWPPSGGAGVQRWLKMSKLLPEFGFDPLVLTIHPESAFYPVEDKSLLKDVSDQVEVIYVKAFDTLKLVSKIVGKKQIPHSGFSNTNNKKMTQRIMRLVRGNLFIPDPRKSWNNAAYKKASELINKHSIELVVTSSPPHSTQLIGLKLKQRLGIRWIADLRDPWMEIYYYDLLSRSKRSKRKDAKYEQQVMEFCDSIITVGSGLKKAFSNRVPHIDSSKFNVVYNGYDENDFKLPIDEIETQFELKGNFKILYTGTFSSHYPIATFLNALAKTDASIHANFVGFQDDSAKTLVHDLGISDRVHFFPYVPHEEVLKLYRKADLLLLLIPDVPQNELILTGKLFEYLASKKMILGIGPKEGDAAHVLHSCKSGRFFEEEDSVLSFMQQVYQGRVTFESEGIEEYSRKSQVHNMVTHLFND